MVLQVRKCGRGWAGLPARPAGGSSQQGELRAPSVPVSANKGSCRACRNPASPGSHTASLLSYLVVGAPPQVDKTELHLIKPATAHWAVQTWSQRPCYWRSASPQGTVKTPVKSTLLSTRLSVVCTFLDSLWSALSWTSWTSLHYMPRSEATQR